MTSDQAYRSQKDRLHLVNKLLSAIAPVIKYGSKRPQELRWALLQVASRLKNDEFTCTSPTEEMMEEWVERGKRIADYHLYEEQKRYEDSLECSCPRGFAHYNWCPKIREKQPIGKPQITS